MSISDNIPQIIIATQKIICYVIGFLIIKLGYQLIVSGVKGKFKFSAKYSGISGGLVSSSPGLLFVALGIFLIGYTMFVDKAIVTKHQIVVDNKADTTYHPSVPKNVDPLP